jgi:hypothetical protein
MKEISNLPFQKYAIIVNSNDNAAIAKIEIAAAPVFELPDGAVLEILATITLGHRFANRRIETGELVLKNE